MQFERHLLTLSPLQDESTLGADEHYELITYFLGLYGKSWGNVVALVGDNCSVNKRLAVKSSTPLVGCASHRFNLGVQYIIEQHSDTVSKVQKLMVNLRTMVAAAKLRENTSLKAKLSCSTR